MKARFKFYDDPDKMETEIRKYIHQGSSISEAKKSWNKMDWLNRRFGEVI